MCLVAMRDRYIDDDEGSAIHCNLGVDRYWLLVI